MNYFNLPWVCPNKQYIVQHFSSVMHCMHYFFRERATALVHFTLLNFIDTFVFMYFVSYPSTVNKPSKILRTKRVPTSNPLLEIAKLQRQGCRQNLLVLFHDIHQTKAGKISPSSLTGETKNQEIFQEVPEGSVSRSLPSPCCDLEGVF